MYEALAQLGDDPAVRDTVALIEEYHLGLETPVVDLWAERVPATSVSALLQDADEFARDMRRPMPVKPSSFSALGTVFHAWAERELHVAGADPASEAVDPSAVASGEDVALAGGDDGADEAARSSRGNWRTIGPSPSKRPSPWRWVAYPCRAASTPSSNA